MGIEIKSRASVALATTAGTFELLELVARAHPDFVAKYVRTNISQATDKDLFLLPDNGS